MENNQLQQKILKQDTLNNLLLSVDDFVNKGYLTKLETFEVVPFKSENLDEIVNQIRFLKICQITYDKNEDINAKLVNVFNSLNHKNNSLIYLINSTKEKIELFVGIKTIDLKTDQKKILENSLAGNFPGIKSDSLKSSESLSILHTIFSKEILSVTAISGIPALKQTENKGFVQGLEKFIEGNHGNEYSAIFIADSVTDYIPQIRNGLEEVYSKLSPFAESQLTFGINESVAVSESLSSGFTETISDSISKSSTISDNDSTTKSYGGAVTGIMGLIGTGIGTAILPGVGTMIGGSIGGAIGGLVGSMMGSKTTGTTTSESESTQTGTSTAKSETTTTGDTKTTGESETIQIKFENKTIKELLSKIDNQLNRLKVSENYGLWNFSGYFVARDPSNCRVAASNYLSIVRGDESNNELYGITTWSASDPEKKQDLQNILGYLKSFKHPVFEYKTVGDYKLPNITSSSLVNTKELSVALSLPRKSLIGLPVIEMSEFGRNVFKYNESSKTFKVGNIFHLGKEYDEQPVNIDYESLSAHTFITGTTGSGKSNTVYSLLNELSNRKIKFLVIEPAKGEYKNIFGGRPDVKVFGTNPQFAPLLQLNPFSFPEQIHVLEHIDRLLDIFNAAWPMYAAMPYILKESIEKCYLLKNWDLENSVCFVIEGEENTYPIFSDLLDMLSIVIDGSEYSPELKGNYKGALETRVKSLTNGLNGRIFTEDEIDGNILFDENCIVDISRIGSSETKSLIMGILVMKLFEYRMSNKKGENEKLRHVTVLEEAHNLFKKTSTEQSADNSNLLGKSIEMLTNAIAEMRTYGQGFIIADQAPGLLDTSVIRNTRTKIILQLPEAIDREMVGKAMNLKEEQIDEISKFKTGVGVIYQNNWIDAVLCQFSKFENFKRFVHNYDVKKVLENDKFFKSQTLKLLLHKRVSETNRFDLEKEFDFEKFFIWLENSSFNKALKKQIKSIAEEFKNTKKIEIWNQEKFRELSKLCSELVDFSQYQTKIFKSVDYNEYNYNFCKALRNEFDFAHKVDYEYTLLQTLLSNMARNNENLQKFYFSWADQFKKGDKVL